MKTPIIIDNLQIWPEDLGYMTWAKAMKRAKGLGPGWRLPTKEEFMETLYPNVDKIPNMKSKHYWSGTESTDHTSFATVLFFTSIGIDYHRITSDYPKRETNDVRPVRDFNGDAALKILLKEF
jgi:hypothetical protein